MEYFTIVPSCVRLRSRIGGRRCCLLGCARRGGRGGNQYAQLLLLLLGLANHLRINVVHILWLHRVA